MNEIAVEHTADSLGIAFTQDIRPFIDVIDNLRRLGLQQDIDLPKVVVVGDQSSGKSSIIEAISGIELPRGKNIVTRCPLELQLKKVVNSSWEAILSYETLEDVQERFEINEPHQVGVHIREAQQKMCETNNGVSPELITLRVESPAETAPDLTLIDLPGIARIALQDQPGDICEKIKDIIMDHIENENTVILCVVSANLDVAVNESIQIAKQVDPEGKRTFGVITKPDTAEEENKEEVLRLLNNKIIPLEKGYHMVKCRSQKALDDNLSLEESLENEEKFFNNDKYYSKADKSLVGTKNLALKITKELVHVIQSILPNLEEEINIHLQESEQSLSNLPRAIPETRQGKLIYMVEFTNQMIRDINTFLTLGDVDESDENMFHSWNLIFRKFTNDIESIKTKSVSNELSLPNLKREILKRRSNEISGFLNFKLFQKMITNHVMSYKSNAESTLINMTSKTVSELLKIIENNFRHLPAVLDDLKHIATSQLDLANQETLKRINLVFEEEKLIFATDNSMQMEMSKISKKEKLVPENPSSVPKHSLFGFSSSYLQFSSPTVQVSQAAPGVSFFSQRQCNDANEMYNIIKCYMKVVHTRLSDRIPMTIRQCLHIEFNKALEREFISYSTNDETLEKVIETRKISEDRKEIQNKIKRLKLSKIELGKL